MSFKEMKFEDLKYLVQYPEDYTEGKKYPVVLFLHGAGSRRQDFEKLRVNPFLVTKNLLHERAVLYAPLCNADSWFDIFEHLRRFAKYLSKKDDTDENRLYLVGASMGGYAVWQMAMSDPELYAGLIPICGGGMYWNGARLKDKNVWAFHGRKDRAVSCEESIKMVESINAHGGKAKLTIFEECGHRAWDMVYCDNAIMEWLLNCRREQVVNLKKSDIIDSPELYG